MTWEAGRDEGDLTADYRVACNLLPSFYAVVAGAEDTVVYSSVTVALNTHDAGGAITERDTALAARIDSLAREHGAEHA